MLKVIAVFLMLSVPADALAMRCGTKLISRGDYLPKVLHECGKPAFRQHWVQRRVVYLHAHPWSVAQAIAPVVVNLWTYNFGRDRFMQQLKFENGRLVRIKTLGYGYSRQ